MKFLCQLLAFRRNPVSPRGLIAWLDRNQSELAGILSPGILLKLRSNNIQKIMSAIAVLLPACTHCDQVGAPTIFASRQEHSSYAKRVDGAISNGILKRVKSPNWLLPDNSQMGADAYFECAVCGAIWSLVEPERQDNGKWERIA
jgi:hypothetical protein